MSLQFTGKERDAESGLDYFGARYFSGSQGVPDCQQGTPGFGWWGACYSSSPLDGSPGWTISATGSSVKRDSLKGRVSLALRHDPWYLAPVEA
jgi:hypothetical protein